MVISKNQLQYIVDRMPEQLDLAIVFDKILLMAKVEQALAESEQGLGEDWEDFKEVWVKEDR